MRKNRKPKKQRSTRSGTTAIYTEQELEGTTQDWDSLLSDDLVDDEYGEFDNGPHGRNSSQWQDPQDGFSSSGRGNILKKPKQNATVKQEEEESDFEDPKRWRTSMGDW